MKKKPFIFNLLFGKKKDDFEEKKKEKEGPGGRNLSDGRRNIW